MYVVNVQRGVCVSLCEGTEIRNKGVREEVLRKGKVIHGIEKQNGKSDYLAEGIEPARAARRGGHLGKGDKVEHSETTCVSVAAIMKLFTLCAYLKIINDKQQKYCRNWPDTGERQWAPAPKT